jgi:hypothetical protein
VRFRPGRRSPAAQTAQRHPPVSGCSAQVIAIQSLLEAANERPLHGTPVAFGDPGESIAGSDLKGAAMMHQVVRRVLFVALAASLLFLGARLQGFYWPGNQQDYEPVQPIEFSHRIHAGKLEISCLYCHFAAERSRYAGIPSASQCMNCHGLVTASRDKVLEGYRNAQKEGLPVKPVVSQELQKLYTALGLDEKLQPDPTRKPTPIAWIRIHKLPSFTYFDHRSHLAAGVDCQTCHGKVETMDRVRQVTNLSMGWCVKCHRERKLEDSGKKSRPSTDCSACHY